MSRSIKLPTDLILQPESDLGKIQVNKERFDAFATNLNAQLITLTARIQERWPMPEAMPQRPVAPISTSE